MQRGIVLAFVVLFASSVAASEDLRIAVARGESLKLRGPQMEGRTDAASEPFELGEEIVLEAVGPFVSDGERLAERFHIRSRSDRPIRVDSFELLGSLEIVAGANGGLIAVDVLDLETYVASVVGGEMPASWPPAALQAQAIAARTYALRRLENVRGDAVAHLESTVLHQVYGGAASLDPRTRAAAVATRGLVLTWQEALADAYFFASCRGTTESAAWAFGTAASYLEPVPCTGGEAAPTHTWTRRFSIAELDAHLRGQGAIGDRLASIEVLSRTPTGRVASARLKTRHGARTVTGAELRRLVGYRQLPSLDFEVSVEKGGLVFSGGGAGHAVGLCQWCARGMAADGASYARILGHFYPGAELRRWEGRDAAGRPKLATAP